jgi:hypothetical protein
MKDTTDTSVETTDVGNTDADVGGTIQGLQPTKKPRNPRHRNMLDIRIIVVTRVNNNGKPVSLRKATSAYGNALGCIVRE